MLRLLFISLLFPLAFNAQVTHQQAIEAVLNQQAIDWNHGDIEGFMNGYWKNDSLRFIGKKGISYGWNKVLENYKKSYPDKVAMGILTFGALKIELLGEAHALVTGSWRVATKTTESGGWFSLIFQYIDERWVIVLDHTS